MSLCKSAMALTLAAGAIGVLPAVTFAQEQPVVEVPNAKFNFVGEINSATVNVRSGPAESYYITMKLNKGDKVLVVGHKFDWLKIAPPAGAFSYVHKTYVERQGTSDQGKITKDEVLVRAGSSVMVPPVPQPQMKLDAGAMVTILGEAGELYKIKPPEGAYLYVAKKFVDPVHQATTDEALPAPKAYEATPRTPAGEPEVAATPSTASGQAGPQGTDTSLVPVPPLGAHGDSATPATGNTPAVATPATFAELEKQFAATKDQPVEQRPISEMLSGYQSLVDGGTLNASSLRMAKFRVEYLKVLDEQQKAIKDAKESQSNFSARQVELETQRKQIEEKLRETGIAVYTAVGKLQTSTISKDGQPLFRLADPADGRSLVYIQTADPKFRGMIDQFVGVRGEITKDAHLSVDIIEPVQMEVVDPAKVMKGVSARIYPRIPAGK